MNDIFDALFISQADGDFKKEIRKLSVDNLPAGDLLVKVSFSSLNYKDALSASGNKGVTKKYPHVPGIDAVGIIVDSSSSDFAKGDSVLVTGFDLGMNTWGGFGQYIRIPSEWAIKLPHGLTHKEAMSLGTAGLTAGLSIEKILAAGISPENGSVIISGATGGVGSMASAMMSKLGFEVIAISGKKEDQFLTSILGVNQIMGRDEFIEKYNAKPMSSADFAAGIDNVGGPILSGILKSVKQNGVVTSCGNVASADLNTTIFPFILRGITLAGIDSAQATLSLRKKIWEHLATDWKPLHLDEMVQEIGLKDLAAKLEDLLQGKAKGRYVLKHAS